MSTLDALLERRYCSTCHYWMKFTRQGDLCAKDHKYHLKTCDDYTREPGSDDEPMPADAAQFPPYSQQA